MTREFTPEEQKDIRRAQDAISFSLEDHWANDPNDPMNLIRAARVALWALGFKDLAVSLELAMMRWDSHRMDPKDYNSPPVTCFGDALGFAHQSAKTGAEKMYINSDGVDMPIGTFIVEKVGELVDGMPSDQPDRFTAAYKEVERTYQAQLRIGAERIARIYNKAKKEIW